VIGAGEPALPGVAAGHNERVAFGFTIVGIDQQDLYVERLDPASPDRYLYRASGNRCASSGKRSPSAASRRAPSSCASRGTARWST